MSTDYPVSIQDLDAGRGTSGQPLSSPNHVTHHNTEDDTIEALQAKVGIDGSAVTTSHDYKLSGVTGSDKAVSLTGSETLTNKILTSPKINVGSDADQDIYVRDASGNFTRLALGNANELLGVNGAGTALGYQAVSTVTTDEKAALAGDLGSPSASNLYVTEQGLQKGAEIYAADAEASDTYVITLDPVPASLYTGMVIHFKANTANTGAATLNVNSLGAKAIKKANSVDLATGDIEAGQIVTVTYDGTDFQMQSQLAQTNKIAVVTSDVNVQNTTSETNLISETISGGTLGTDDAIRATLKLSTLKLGSSTPTYTIRLKYGSTTVASANITLDTAAAVLKGKIEVILAGSGATNTQEGSISLFGNTNGTLSGGTGFTLQDEGTAAEDSTGDLTLAVTVEYSAAGANNQTTMAHAVVEKIN